MAIRLESASLRGFQSYWDPQTVEFDRHVTLIAGRNDVGKSALLRALRCFADAVEGVRDDFQLTLRAPVTPAEIAAIRPGLPPPGEWLTQDPQEVVAVTFASRNTPTPPRGQMGANFLAEAELRLVKTGLVATGPPGTQIGWTTGPLAGSSTGVPELVALITGYAAQIAYLAPRRIQPGARGAQATPVLTPTGENLTEVVFHLQNNEPLTGYRALIDFVQSAFPQIATVTAAMATQPAMTELHVVYAGAPERLVPLNQCGTGIEQMLALGAAVLTNPEPRMFLIDEPQAYLHPHAERSLQAFLAEHSQHQYVVATHSGVFLNAHPLSRTRLVTMDGGQTRITSALDLPDVLGELGITPADLWLAERVMWVEGGSDVAIVEVIQASQPDELGQVRVRAMPAASQLAARSVRGQEQTFDFLGKVVAAIAPLPVEMLFVFDADEKPEDLRNKIEGASGGRARFLPAREIENLLLDPPSIAELLMSRASLYDLPTPATADIVAALQALLNSQQDAELFPRGVAEGQTAEAAVVGSQLLDRLWQQFLNTEYRKVDDGRDLAALVLQREPRLLAPLVTLLRELAD